MEEGVGLSNTRARLAQLYGGAARFEIGNVVDGGVLATALLPFRLANNTNTHGSGNGRGDS
jgi:hypothetical protein